MTERKKRRKVVSATSYLRRRAIVFGLLFFALPLFLMSLIASFDSSPVFETRVAKELERTRSLRGDGFPAAPGTHKVVRVVTGDMMDIRAPGSGVVRIRIDCIDAPERGQSYWLESRRHLARLIDGRFVTVELSDSDVYDLPVASIVSTEGSDIARRMIEDGFAWGSQSWGCGADYDSLEQRAQSDQRGLWQGLNPVPPWQWRQA